MKWNIHDFGLGVLDNLREVARDDDGNVVEVLRPLGNHDESDELEDIAALCGVSPSKLGKNACLCWRFNCEVKPPHSKASQYN